MSRFHARLNRPRWLEARAEALDRAGYQCERCQRPGRLEVHHREALQDGGAPYAQSNLEVLCRDCHIRASGFLPVRGRPEWQRRLKRAITG